MKEQDIFDEVCNDADCDYGYLSCTDWLFYLKKKLNFPFNTEINLYSYSRVLNDGDIVSVKELDGCYDMYGIIATVKLSRRKFHVPVVEMTVCDEKSENYFLIEAYNTWFSNL